MPGELEHAVKCRCNHNCTLDDISNTLQETTLKKEWQKWKRRKILVTIVAQQTTMPTTVQRQRKIYVIEKFPEEESLTEDSESDSIGDAIREQSDYE
ncbi:hypothetical protein O181_085009 [Austropuccinia psidii MF-1]|uniref:Uncharacterized protein n=1 Tax=Austropuccinia psidii MF-1 TaxID=1389203 RepID=A0A9Q3FU68_9BASI|nr:hypothetical protein [Austropuccinia psidii MF-1]